jgi:hypothetical protein
VGTQYLLKETSMDAEPGRTANPVVDTDRRTFARRISTEAKAAYKAARWFSGSPTAQSAPAGPARHAAAHPEQEPLRTWRWSRQRPPRRGVIAGSKGASRAHSSSVSSNRRFTAGFYRINRAPPKPTHRSEKHALGGWCFSRARMFAG